MESKSQPLQRRFRHPRLSMAVSNPDQTNTTLIYRVHSMYKLSCATT